MAPAVNPTLDMEACRLIDPLEQEAWLISFERNDDGECLACSSPGVEGDDLERVNVTINVLGLNRLESLNRNRTDIWDQCLTRIQDYNNAAKEQVMHTRKALRLMAARELATLSAEEAEFSSVAKACIAKQAPCELQLYVADLLQHPDLLKTAA